ncbi:MAG: PAS domain S-box protein, partial [Chlorobia bacterium]|nr:PAS domain S-box protein [Fimbriimonadaceae bacterium]
MFLLRLSLDILPGAKVIFLPYFFVIIGAAALGGLGPGLVATLLAMLAGGYFLLDSLSAAPDYSQLILFGLVGFLMSVVGESFHKAKRKLHKQSQDLDVIKERLESTESARTVALEAGRMGTWEWSMSTNSVSWSPTMGQIYELDEDSFPTSVEGYLSFVHPDDRERVQANLEKTVSAALPTFEGRYRIVLRNEEVRWIASRGHSIISEGVVSGLRGVCWDVTEDAKADISQARLATIVSSSDDGIVSKDLNGKILTWNGGAEQIFGYTAEETIGQSIQLLLPEDRLSEESEILAKLRAGKSIKNLETVRKRKDGRLIDVTVTISPIFDAEGRIVAVSKFVRDIT